MKAKSVWITLVAVALFMTEARAGEGFGVGGILGEPTGLSAKLWLRPTRALAGAAAWSFSGNESFQIHLDYLLHDFDVLRAEADAGRWALYYGVGGRIREKDNDRRNGRDDDASVGVRIPVGITFLFARAPVDLFAEVVPILDVTPDTDFELNAAIGGRFYFR